MNATFQTGRKSALLSKRLKKDRFRRGLIITIITLIALPAILYTLKYYVERSYEFTDGEYDSVKISFDAQIAYNKARALIEEGKANEFKGRKQIVMERFEEALELLMMIDETAPDYKREKVARDIEYLQDRLRKAK
jgi:hypothetical protein